MEIRCESRIDRVVVHARGALVRRSVAVPAELPAGELDLVVPGLALLAAPGSLRASLQSASRGIVFAQLGLHISATAAVVGQPVEKLRELERRLERLRAEEGALQRRRAALEEVQPRPSGRSLLLGSELSGRVRDGLACAAIVRDEIAALDERLLRLARDAERLELERNAARLEEAQASAAARRGAGQTLRQATVRLTGSGAVEALELTYLVPGARWWPCSTLKLSDGGAKAAWTLEALVAQATGEDWQGCKLGLSTADLDLDARLPELASLRFGRAQARPRTGYRPPPQGLDQLFGAFDRSFPAGLPSGSASAPVPIFEDVIGGASIAAEPPPPMPFSRPPASPPPSPMPSAAGGIMHDSSEAEALPSPQERSAKSMAPRAPAAASPSRGGAAMMMMATPSFGLGKGGVASSPPPSPEPEELEPSSGWLEFDALALPGPDDRARRGKLARTRGDALSAQRSAAAARLEQLQPGPLLRDPLTSRGLFDHRFDADGLVEIPSDGVAHRVSLGVAQAAPRLRLRTVPREAPDVFREAELKNPFDAPLLAGPVDVYVEGSLLSTTANDRIDKGGTLTVGMGVEDRVRVARNARADETSAGVFGGSTSVLHSIDIELSSSLGREVTVEVIDRLPVTDNKEIEIVRGDETPASQEYAQAERGSPVRGGRLWRVLLPASGKVRIDWTYRLTFAAKDELVGGNRRE